MSYNLKRVDGYLMLVRSWLCFFFLNVKYKVIWLGGFYFEVFILVDLNNRDIYFFI